MQMTNKEERAKLLEFLRENLGATHREVKDRFSSELDEIGGLPEAMYLAELSNGVHYAPEVFEARRKRIIEYLTKNPEASRRDLTENGLEGHFQFCYGGRISEARKDAGVSSLDLRKIPLKEKERRKTALLDYLKEHPDTTYCNLIPEHKATLEREYSRRIKDAKIEAGISPTHTREKNTKKDKPVSRNAKGYTTTNQDTKRDKRIIWDAGEDGIVRAYIVESQKKYVENQRTENTQKNSSPLYHKGKPVLKPVIVRPPQNTDYDSKPNQR